MDLFRDGYDGVFKGSMAKGWLHVNKSCNERLKDRNHVWTFTPEERTRGSDERFNPIPFDQSNTFQPQPLLRGAYT
jgi:hypothetical protein